MSILNLSKIRPQSLRLSALVTTLFLTSLYACAQAQISGYVLDFNKNPVVGANIIVTDEQEKILVYTFSNNSGFFSLNLPPEVPPKVFVIASGLGLETNKYTLNIDSTGSKYQVSFVLIERLEHLNEVILMPSEKISKTGNITNIRVEPFNDGTEQTIEDVLRGLPGIEVLQDGSIKAHGRFISKLLVEGEDLFDNNYKVLSKNLDAKVLDEVEIIDEFEPNPILSKVIESENVALNLVLKEEYKNVWFGNVGMGLGNENRIRSSMNIGLIRKEIKLFHLGDYNNLGETATSQLTNSSNTININTLIQENRIETSLSPIYKVAPTRIDQMDEGHIVLNDASINSLSFVSNLNPNFKIRGTGIFASDAENQLIFRETLFSTSQEFIQYEENQNTSFKKSNLVGEVELQFSPSENSYLENFAKFNSFPNHAETLNVFNGNNVWQNINDKDISFNNHFNSTHLLWDRHVFHNYFYFGFQSIKQNGGLVSPTLNDFLKEEKSEKIFHLSDDLSKTYGIISTLIINHKPYKQSIELGYQSNKITNENQLFVRANDQHISIDSLENNQTFDLNKFRVTLKSNYNLSDKISLNTDLSIENWTINFYQGPLANWLFSPSVSLRFKNLEIGNFGFEYHRNIDEPLANFFLENFQLSGFQSFKKGVRDISMPRNNLFGVYYQIGNEMKTQQLSIRTRFKNTEQQYAQDLQINESIILSEYQLVKGGRTYSGSLDYTSYFKRLNFSSNIGANIDWNEFPYKLNTDEFINLESLSQGVNLSGTTYFNYPLNIDFDLNLNWAKSNYNGIESYSNWTNLATNIIIKINKEIAGSISNKYLKMPESKYFNMDLNLNYAPENSRFSYRLIANNITNQGYFSIRNIDEYSTTNIWVKLIPRYILTSVKYRF